MKKTITLICLMMFCFVGLKSYSQTTWAPTGAVWHYTYYYGGFWLAEGFKKMTSIGDTVIQGKDCKVLELSGPGIDSLAWDNVYFYTYESSDTIWLFDGTNFRILYNFNVNPGDSFETYGPSLHWCDDTTTMVVVDSVGYETVNGLSLKYIIVHFIEPEWGFQNCTFWIENYKIYQKIGCIGYTFPQKICMIDGDGICELRCYDDFEIGFFNTGSADSCTYEHGVSVKEIDYSDNIKIYPNPVVDQFTIELNNFNGIVELSIFSIDGRLLKQLSLTNKVTAVDLSDAQKGCYILRFGLGNELYQARIIK